MSLPSPSAAASPLTLPFVKLHGIGNDFLFVDGRNLDVDLTGPLGARLCDRHIGVGADGVLVLLGTLAAPQMRVVNADGSIAEMCGNGLRCFAKVLGDDHLPTATALTVQTGKGPLTCQLRRDAAGRVDYVTVDVGEVSFAPRAVPLAADIVEAWIDRPVQLGADGAEGGDRTDAVRLTAVHTGNPHGVVFEPVSPARRRIVGPLLHAATLFPARANIEFVDVLAAASDGTPRLAVEVFERGVGWTRACGTGAVASVAAAVRLGHVAAGAMVAVRLPGGWLEVRVDVDQRAQMGGAAVEVFRGVVTLTPGSGAEVISAAATEP